MAILKCSECSGSVSTIARACPHCGAPLQLPPTHAAPPSNNLAGLLGEQFTELRWRRDIEDKLVRWTVGINVGILTACLTIAQFAARPLVGAFIAVAWFLLLGTVWRLIEKIRAEHGVYVNIGKSIVAILSNEHSFDKNNTAKPFVGESLKGLGDGGGGSEKTVSIIRYFTGITLIALAVLFGYVSLTDCPLQNKPVAESASTAKSGGS